MPEPPSSFAPGQRRQPLTSNSVMRKAAADSYGCHSDVYRWLLRKHRQVSKALAKHEPSWQTITDMLIADGVSGRAGSTPNPNSVCRVWARVCRDIDAKRRGSSTKRQKKKTFDSQRAKQTPVQAHGGSPSRSPAKPPEAPPRSSLLGRVDPLPATNPALIVNNTDCTPEEALAGLRRIIDHRSGR